jgi:hypothetical protein
LVEWRGGGLGRGVEHWKFRPGLAFVLSLTSGLHKRRLQLACGSSFIYLRWATAKQ